MLAIAETLKECRNTLLGHRIEVITDHKNLVFKTFNAERVMRWRLIIEEFGPKLTHIKGESNVVADAFSRLDLTEEDFSKDAFTFDLEDDADFPSEFPLSYKQLLCEQQRDDVLQKRLTEKDSSYEKKIFRHWTRSAS